MNTATKSAAVEHVDGSEPRPTVTAELLTLADVASLMRCSRRSVARLADAGKMPHGLKVGGMRRWRRAELMSWLAAGCPPVRTPKGGPR